MTPYVSIDVETTGLDPNKCQIIQIAAVVDHDFMTPVEELSHFVTAVRHQFYNFHHMTLKMNWKLIEAIINDTIASIEADSVCPQLTAFLDREQAINKDGKFIAVGKNYGGFDRQFLERLPNWSLSPHYRSPDPVGMYWNPLTDEVPPGAEECCKRAGFDFTKHHDALEDARMVIKLIREAKKIPDGDLGRP
jgi:DNA polymerase III epsilon subunit-like protein